MYMKTLGNTHQMIPEIGIGTWRYKGNLQVIHQALALGATLIDTAEMYRTEHYVGAAIEGNRSSYFVATKVSGGNLGYADVMKAADASLKRLGTEFTDLYQVHWPNPRIPIDETMSAMARLVRTGKVRYIGVSNFSVDECVEAQNALDGNLRIQSNQVRYSLFDRSIETSLLPYCERNHITIIAYGSLVQGNVDAELRKRPELSEIVDGICESKGLTRAQVLLAWTIHHPLVITIPQTNQEHRVRENCDASGHRLSEQEYEALCGCSVTSDYTPESWWH
jgi:diketogulonate reductase-like aldo/keto reductase